jgi:hypothetical protein
MPSPLTGAAGFAAPQSGLLPIGLDQIKTYLAKGNVAAAEGTVQLLRQSLGNPATAWMPADPTPFTSPQFQPGMAPGWNPAYAGAAGMPVSHPALESLVGSNLSIYGGQPLAQALNNFIDGSPQAKGRVLTGGTPESDTVLAALKQDSRLFYNADSQRFFVHMPDGSKRDVCSLADARKALAQNSSTAGGSSTFGDYLKAKIDEAVKLPTTASVCEQLAELYPRGGGDPEELNQKLDEIKKKLQQYEQVKRLMAPLPSVDPK